jgi:dTDP-glucose pyrophosphorylase
MIGVIPAAGQGTRAYPYTRRIPKAMLEVEGEPNLARTIALMRDQLGITDIVVVVGALGEMIEEHFGDGAGHGVRIRYARNDAVGKGLSYSILLARPYVGDQHFCVILGDECYVDTDHAALLQSDYRSALATCAVMSGYGDAELQKNYAVTVDGDRIRRLVEKPRPPCDGLLGVGTFIFAPAIFAHLEAALADPAAGPTDPVSVLARLCAGDAVLRAFALRGQYVNINDRDALNLANNLVRSRDFAARTIDLVLLAKGHAESIRRVVEDFRAGGRFRRIVLVGGPQGIGGPPPDGVEYVQARSTDYGEMMRSGLDAATADIVVTALSDGSYAARDLSKFLEYLKDADLVVGTRTTRQLIQQGSNMRGVVRLAHVVLAKLLELVWWEFEPRLTDVGCAYRAVWRSAYRTIRPLLRSPGPGYAVEMLLEMLRARKRVIEIPISFHPQHPDVREDQQTWRTFVSAATLILARRFSRHG